LVFTKLVRKITMLESLSNNSKHIIASGDGSSYPTVAPPVTSCNHFHQGDVRFVNGAYEVWNGSGWQRIIGHCGTIGLTANADLAISWAIQKMQEEKELDALCKEFPALDKARRNFETVKHFVSLDQ